MLLHYRLLVYPCSKFGTEADQMLMTSSEHKTFVTGTLSRGKGVHREGRGCSHMLAVNRTCQVSPIIIISDTVSLIFCYTDFKTKPAAVWSNLQR